MNTSTVIALTGGFLKFVGELIAEIKRQDLAKVDTEQLELKRCVLAEKFEDFKSGLATAATQEKAKAEQDLISRGLVNTSVRQSSLRAIEQDAASELERATREYNRAIEEISLMERKLKIQNRPPWWKKVLRRLRFFQG